MCLLQNEAHGFILEFRYGFSAGLARAIRFQMTGLDPSCGACGFVDDGRARMLSINPGSNFSSSRAGVMAK